MSSLPPTAAPIIRPSSPMQVENQASNPQAKLEFPSSSMVQSTPQDIDSKPPLPKKPRKNSTKLSNARAGSAEPPVRADVDGEPAYRLSRVQKIAKMNDQAQISREAVFVMALAAEHITRRLTRAGCEVATNAHRLGLSLSDVATAVQASTSLSFLSEVIPQTIPLSTARSRRLTKDIAPFPPDATQIMISRVQDQLRHSSRPVQGYPAHNTGIKQMGASGGHGAPVPVLMAPSGSVPIPVRNYSPREAAAVAKSKAGQGSGSDGRSFVANAAGVPVGPMGPMMPLPPGFDYQTLAGMPPPPPGMAYHHLDPESYRNGIRWAPVQAQPQPGSAEVNAQAPEGMVPVWADASGQLVMPGPAMYQALPLPPNQRTASESRPARRGTSVLMTREPRQRKQPGTPAQSQPSPSPVPADSPAAADITPGSLVAAAAAHSVSPGQPDQPGSAAPGSPFHPGQLQGRTIYNAGAGGSFSPAPPPKAKANGSSKKKRTSTKGRGSTVKKPWGEDGEDEDSMDLNA